MIRYYIVILLVASVGYQIEAQTTYSKTEELMAQFVNNGWAYAMKYDSLQRIPPVLDSCRRFLQHYPNSFVKPNVFSYMLEMTSLITNDKYIIFQLIDSVLSYDSRPSTLMWVGELLIEREIDPKRGALMVEDVLPHLTVPYHRYKSHLLLAQIAQSQGNISSAESHLKSALGIDSVRLDAWYEYLSYYQMLEDNVGASTISHKIFDIENQKKNKYYEYMEQNTYVDKSILDLTPVGLDGNTVYLSQFTNRVMVIQFFNFWCGTPGKEFPTIKHLIKEFPKVKFLFFNFGETPDELKLRYFTRPSSRFLKDQTVLFADSSVNCFLGGDRGMGEILLIDKHGMVRFAFPGMTKGYEAVLRTKLRQLLEEH